MYGADRARGARRPNADDVALVGAIRRGDATAIVKFIERMMPILLDATRNEDVAQSERETLVVEFLDDVVLELRHIPVPASPAGFVTTAFRRRLSDRVRSEAARQQRDINECESVGGESTVAAACSDYTRQTVLAPDADDLPTRTPRVIGDFLEALTKGCSDDDKQLLVYASQRVPLRDCAKWLGISYDAAKQRIARLRGRLRASALERVAALDPPDRAIIVRLLMRAGVLVTDPLNEVSNA